MQHPLRQLACEYKASGLWFPHMVGMDVNQVMEKWKFVPGLQTMRFYFQGLLELFGVPNVERTAAASITLLMQMHYIRFSTDGRAHGVDADLHSRAVFLCREVMSSVESMTNALELNAPLADDDVAKFVSSVMGMHDDGLAWMTAFNRCMLDEMERELQRSVFKLSLMEGPKVGPLAPTKVLLTRQYMRKTLQALSVESRPRAEIMVQRFPVLREWEPQPLAAQPRLPPQFMAPIPSHKETALNHGSRVTTFVLRPPAMEWEPVEQAHRDAVDLMFAEVLRDMRRE